MKQVNNWFPQLAYITLTMTVDQKKTDHDFSPINYTISHLNIMVYYYYSIDFINKTNPCFIIQTIPYFLLHVTKLIPLINQNIYSLIQKIIYRLAIMCNLIGLCR